MTDIRIQEDLRILQWSLEQPLESDEEPCTIRMTDCPKVAIIRAHFTPCKCTDSKTYCQEHKDYILECLSDRSCYYFVCLDCDKSVNFIRWSTLK